jgi:tetratricopeptide (TPR) repeat protein
MKLAHLLCCLLIAFVSLHARPAAADGKGRDDLKSRAFEAYEREDYKRAARLFTEAGREEGDPSDFYNAACSYALAGKTRKAFELLSEAIARGFNDLEHLKSDSDLKSLRDDPRWAALVGAQEEAPDEEEASGEAEAPDEGDLTSRAFAAYHRGDYAVAAELFLRAAEDRSDPKPLYNAACSYALLGESTIAIKLLAAAITLGFDDLEHLKSDSDLESLHDNPRWPALIKMMKSRR